MDQISERLKALAETISKQESQEDIDDDLDFVVKNISALPEYYQSVIALESRIIIFQFHASRDSAEKTAELDQQRRDKHILAAQAINKINRLSKSFGLEPVFETGLERDLKPDAKNWGYDQAAERLAKDDREIAADIAYNYCKEMYLAGRNRSRYVGKEESVTRDMRDLEMHEMSNDSVYFKTPENIDDVIDGMNEDPLNDGSVNNKEGDLDERN